MAVVERTTYDFSEVGTGAGAPAGWTQRFSGTNVAYSIAADGSSPGGQVMIVAKSGAGINLLTHDVADGINQHALILVETDDDTASLASVWINASGGTGNEMGYYVELDFNNDTIALWEGTGGGAFFNHAITGMTLNANTKYWARIYRLSDGTVAARVWESGGGEPGAALPLSATDNTHTGGWCGVSEAGNGTFNTTFHWHSVGFGANYPAAVSNHHEDWPTEGFYYSLQADDSVRVTDLDGSPIFLVAMLGAHNNVQQVEWHRELHCPYVINSGAASDGAIMRFDRFFLNREILRGSLTNAFGLTFNYDLHEMYYTTRQATTGSLYRANDDGSSESAIVNGSINWPGHPFYNHDDGFIYVPYNNAVQSWDRTGASQVTYPALTEAHCVVVDDTNVMAGSWNNAGLWYIPIDSGSWTNADTTYNVWHMSLHPDESVVYAAALGNDLIAQWDNLPPPASANRSTVVSGTNLDEIHSVSYFKWPDLGSEIGDDYLNGGSKRKTVIAKKTKVFGVGTVSTRAWQLTEDNLPAELMDTDEPSADLFGGAAIRISKDRNGDTRLNMWIEHFSAVSGGVGSGAEARIWVWTEDADADFGQPVTIWWDIPRKRQRLPGHEWGPENTFNNNGASAWNAVTNPTGSAGDVPDQALNRPGTSFGSMANLVGGPGDIRQAWVSDGTNDEIEWGDQDEPNEFIFEAWVNPINLTTRRAILGKHDGSGTNQVVFLYETSTQFTTIIHGSVVVSGATISGWSFLGYEVTVSGSNTVIRIHRNGTLVATHTHTGVTIGDVSGGHPWRFLQEWDGGTKSDWWANNAAGFRLVPGTDPDYTNTHATLYQNQIDTSDFWDIETFEVETGPFEYVGEEPEQGNLAAGYSSFFHALGCGYGRNWNINVMGFTPGSEVSPSTTELVVHEDIELKYGPATTRYYVIAIPSTLRLEVLDPDLALYNEFLNARVANKTDYWYYIEAASTDGVYTWRGWVKLSLVRRYISDKRINVTDIEAYCGIGVVDTFPIYFPHKRQLSLHHTLRDLLSYSIQPLPIKYLNQWIPTDMEPGQPSIPRLRLKYTEMQILDRTGLIEQRMERDEAFQEIAETLMLTVWQGLDGFWHVKQPAKMGHGYDIEQYLYAPVDTDNTDNFDFSEVTLEDSDDQIVPYELEDFDEDVTIGLVDEVTELTVDFDIDYSTETSIVSDFFENINLFPDPFVTRWDDAVSPTRPLHWEKTSVAGVLRRSSTGGADRYLYMDSASNPPTDMMWPLGWVKIDDDFYLDFEFGWGAERNGGAGDISLEFRVVIRPYIDAPDSESVFLNASGGWSGTAPGWMASVAVTPETAATDPLTIYTLQLRTLQPIPITGRLELELRNSDDVDLIALDDCFVWVVDKDGNNLNQFGRVSLFQNTDKTGGETLDNKVKNHMGIDNYDPTDDATTRIMVYGIDTELSNSSNILGMHAPDRIVVGFNGNGYLASSFEEARALETALAPFLGLQSIEGRVKDIIPPEKLIQWDARVFWPMRSHIKLLTEVSDVYAPERPGGGQVSPYLIFMIDTVDEHFWVMEGDFSPEIDTGLDLSAYDFVDIDRHQGTGKIYGLTSGGLVYSWNEDGSGFEFIFDTTFTDVERIHIDSLNNEILISSHVAGLFNVRMYIYSLLGSALRNYEQRSGTNSISQGIEDIGLVAGEMRAYVWDVGNLYSISMEDGTARFHQTAIGTFEHRGGVIIDTSDECYESKSAVMYEFDPVTVGNPSNAVIIGSCPITNSIYVDWFTYQGERYLIGHTGLQIWSYQLSTNTLTQGRSTNNIKCSCTKHAFDTT